MFGTIGAVHELDTWQLLDLVEESALSLLVEGHTKTETNFSAAVDDDRGDPIGGNPYSATAYEERIRGAR
jgi:hypothetical protein